MAKKRTSQIISLSDDNDYPNLMVYGNSGVGKTVFCGSDDKVLFIAPEDKGTLSAKRRGSTAQKWPIHKWDDLSDAYNYLYDMVEETGELPFKWLAIDSLTELQEMGMRTILKEVIEGNPSRDPDIPALQDYLKNQRMVRRMIQGFNELPVMCIYTANVLQYTNAEGNEALLPNIKGGAKQGHTYAKEICGMMTSFGYLKVRRVKDTDASEEAGKTVKREERQIIWKETVTASDGTITAKDRTEVLAPYTVDKSLADIRRMIEKGNTGQQVTPRKTAARKTAIPRDADGRSPRKTAARSATTRTRQKASA